MTRRACERWTLIALLWWCVPAAAQSPLTLSQVLESLERHPHLGAAAARLEAARGAVRTAEGGFDLSVALRGSVIPAGYYNYGRADASLVQPTGLWGASLYAGWRIGRGWDNGLPDYYGYDETLDRGELRAGATVPLWQNRDIDARRAGVERNIANATAAEHDVVARRLRLSVMATEVYCRWVAATQKARIAQQMLTIAQQRDSQIQQRVAAGAIAAIEHLENQRSVLERQTALVSAQRAVERMAIQLSLFLRRADGSPWVPAFEQAPTTLDFHPWPEVDTDAARALQRAWSTRPEIARLQGQLEAARVSLRLADNQVAPRLDLSLQGSVDLGQTDDPALQQRLAPAVFETSLQFALPLQQREASGRAQTARAELRQVELETEYARNAVEADVRDALSAFANARASVDLATASARVAEQVRDAERARFESGLSTMLLVNLREAAAAYAQGVLVDAHVELALSHALFGAAVGTLGSR